MKHIIVIAGCSASGKSDAAIQVAKAIGGYIINADSKQVYRDIKIATAQPIPQKIRKDGTWVIDGIDHYLYGFASLETGYNVFKYKQDVLKIINKKENRDKFPILVGGTGLYIDSVIFNYRIQQENNSDKRELLNSMTLKQLQEMVGDELKILNESDRANKVRLIRYLEKENQKYTKGETLNHHYFILDPGKETIDKNINIRVEKMMQMGLEKEAKAIYERYKTNLPSSLNIIGFKEFVPYFESSISLEQVVEEIKLHTRQYTKKQRTWFKRNEEVMIVSNPQQIIDSLQNLPIPYK